MTLFLDSLGYQGRLNMKAGVLRFGSGTHENKIVKYLEKNSQIPQRKYRDKKKGRQLHIRPVKVLRVA